MLAKLTRGQTAAFTGSVGFRRGEEISLIILSVFQARRQWTCVYNEV